MRYSLSKPDCMPDCPIEDIVLFDKLEALKDKESFDYLVRYLTYSCF